MALLPVEDARSRILRKVKPLPGEKIPLGAALGRVLAAPVRATRHQPPFPASAMDGYAVIARDVVATPVSLNVIGMSAAGHGFDGKVRSGEAVRIFTGAPVPKGADAVVIQENTAVQSSPYVSVNQSVRPGQNVRAKGLDFTRGETLLEAGTRLNTRDIVGLEERMTGTRPRIRVDAEVAPRAGSGSAAAAVNAVLQPTRA